MAKPISESERARTIAAYIQCDGNQAATARALQIPESTLKSRVRSLGLLDLDLETIEQNVKLAKQKQAAQDTNRIERKSFREYARIENAVAGYAERLCELLEHHGMPDMPPMEEPADSPAVGVLQLTDIHFNEVVELAQNRYDFDIAGKRLRKLVRRASRDWLAQGVSKVVVAFTGDLMNSDRRLDELLANQDNRARATIGAVHIIRQLFEDLMSFGFDIIAADANGNEGRCTKEVGWVAQIASDNYDETICRMVEYMFRDCSRVTWAPRPDPTECVVNVAGHNLLLIHGHQFTKDLEGSVSKTVAKYAKRGVQIRYVISGHIHSGYLNENFGRAPSPVGDNAYSDKALNLTGRAGGAYYTFEPDGSVHASLVDLQACDDVSGYETLDCYKAGNPKSAAKAEGPGTAIFKVVV